MLSHAEGIGAFLAEMRDETFRKYNAFTVGEVFNEKPDELEKFIGDDGYFSSMFDFHEHLIGQSPKGNYAALDVTAEQYKEACFSAQEKIGDIGFYSTLIENHDEPRGVSHFLPAGQVCEAGKKMLAGLYFFLRGLPFIYQGQEIGMENVDFSSIEEVDDISTLSEYQTALDAGLSPEEALKAVARNSRDNARTPVQWDDSLYAGFSSAQPWLRVNPNYHQINVKDQIGRADSLLEFYRSMIRLRRDPRYQETVVYGTFRPYLREQKNLMAYFREGEGQVLLVLGNFQQKEQAVGLPGKVKQVLLNNLDFWKEKEGTVQMAGWQFAVLELE